MPTKRKKRLRVRLPGSRLTPDAKFYLLYGLDLDHPDGAANARRLWFEHRDELMREWLLDPENHGTRPHGWWEFSRPMGKLRRQISGPPPLPDAPIDRGIPSWWPRSDLVFESEAEYLFRLNLLTAEEMRSRPEIKEKLLKAGKK